MALFHFVDVEIRDLRHLNQVIAVLRGGAVENERFFKGAAGGVRLSRGGMIAGTLSGALRERQPKTFNY